MRPPSIEGGRVCLWCSGEVPSDARSDSKFCGVLCRKRSWRFTGAVLKLGHAPENAGEPARFAYADPPYPGKIDYYTDRPSYDWPEMEGDAEIDHRALVGRLVDEFPHGWALSTSSEALQSVLRYCPPVRIASWHRRVRHVRALRPLQSWEPLIVYQGRPYRTGRTQTVLDRLTYEGRYQSYPGALVGMKPPEFAVWMFRQLNACRSDDVVDLFPGSGAIGRAWSIYSGRELWTVPRTTPDTLVRDDSHREPADRG